MFVKEINESIPIYEGQKDLTTYKMFNMLVG